MDQRQHSNEAEIPAGAAGSGETGGENLSAYRDQAARLAAVADSAIRNVLSSDSKAYNHSMQQEGGQ